MHPHRPATARHALADFEADPKAPQTWKGLGADDKALLTQHLDAGTINPTALYVSVPCGAMPDELEDPAHPAHAQGLAESYCKRADLIIRQGDRWEILELKPAAGYVAFGQILCYHRCFRTDWPELTPLYAGILTDAPDPDIVHLARAYGVNIRALPGRAYEPRGRPG